MAIVINDPYGRGGGGVAGEQIGSSIGDALTGLAQRKLQQIEERHNKAKSIRELQQAGYNPQEIAKLNLVRSNPNAFASMMQYYEDVNNMNKQMGLGGNSPQLDVLNNLQVAPQQQPMGSVNRLAQSAPFQVNNVAKNALMGLTKPVNPMDELVSNYLARPEGQEKAAINNTALDTSVANQNVRSATKIEPKFKTSLPDGVLEQIAPSPVKLAEQEARAIKFNPSLKPAERFKQAQVVLNAARKEQQYIDKTTKPYIEELDKKGGKGAKIADMTLDRMSRLIDTGKLTGATMYNLRTKLEHSGHLVGGGIGTALGAVGGALAGTLALPAVGTIGGAGLGATVGGGIGAAAGAALTPKFVGSKEDQEFGKLSKYFLNNMKDIFGARVTTQEVQLYLDSIPTLSLTDEGKKAVINDMKLISDGWKYQKKVKDEIVKANGGIIPQNITSLVDEASSEYLDKLATKFTSGSALTIKT